MPLLVTNTETVNADGRCTADILRDGDTVTRIGDEELWRTLGLAKERGVVVTAHCENGTLVAEEKGVIQPCGDVGTSHPASSQARPRGLVWSRR